MKKYFKLIKNITGTQYIISVLIIGLLKYSQEYYLPIFNNKNFIDIFLINFFGVILILINWYRSRRFVEWKYYFISLTIFGLIHSIGFTFFDSIELLNSNFFYLVKISTIGTLLITIVMTILNSNKQ
jgi:hypothetical protein